MIEEKTIHMLELIMELEPVFLRFIEFPEGNKVIAEVTDQNGRIHKLSLAYAEATTYVAYFEKLGVMSDWGFANS